MTNDTPALTWIRYRFSTKAKDYRPIVFNPRFPWWCSGTSGRKKIIVAYLPAGEELSKYWDDASGVDSDLSDGPVFTDRFPRPSYFVESSPGDDLLSTEQRA